MVYWLLLVLTDMPVSDADEGNSCKGRWQKNTWSLKWLNAHGG